MDEKKKSGQFTSADFEKKIADLQSIVDRLEGDKSVTLEDSMSLFESGIAITRECVDSLNAMQARISALNKELDLIICGDLGTEDD